MNEEVNENDNASMPEPCIVICTTSDDKNILHTIAAELVSKNLAACVQIIGPINSHYRWQGQLELSNEWQAQIKSRLGLFCDIERVILQKHNYDLPEIIATEIVDGSKAYLSWIYQQTTQDGTSGDV